MLGIGEERGDEDEELEMEIMGGLGRGEHNPLQIYSSNVGEIGMFMAMARTSIVVVVATIANAGTVMEASY